MKTMDEARSKDELYRKIYHEPEGNIGVLRVKLMYSLFLFFREIYMLYYERKKGADCGYREDPTPIDKIVLRFSNELGMIKALFANL